MEDVFNALQIGEGRLECPGAPKKLARRLPPLNDNNLNQLVQSGRRLQEIIVDG